MDRDNIKIIEFDKGDAPSSRAGTSDGGAVKVREFGGDTGASAGRASAAKDVGRIKIVEFDDGPAPRAPRHTAPAAPATTGKRVGPIKIKEFDDDREPRQSTGGKGNIKIMEFD
jgi:hypothetical protein